MFHHIRKNPINWSLSLSFVFFTFGRLVFLSFWPFVFLSVIKLNLSFAPLLLKFSKYPHRQNFFSAFVFRRRLIPIIWMHEIKEDTLMMKGPVWPELKRTQICVSSSNHPESHQKQELSILVGCPTFHIVLLCFLFLGSVFAPKCFTLLMD